MKRTIKHIFFETRDAAERFKMLYDNDNADVIIDIENVSYWARNYYGPKTMNKIHVSYWIDTENFEKVMKAIGLKEKHWAGHLCYSYEG